MTTEENNKNELDRFSFACSNGIDVEGASHKQVVDLIKHSQDELHLVVIASAGDEMHSDIHSGEESSGSSNDYTERRSLAITLPDYSLLEANEEKFYVSSTRIELQ